MNGHGLEDVVAEVRRTHRQAARVRSGVEHLEPVVEAVVHGAAGRELDDEVGALVQGVDGVFEPAPVEGGLVVVVADVHVDHRGAGGLAALGRLHQLAQRRGQLRAVLLGRLRSGRRHRDQQLVLRGRARAHGRHRVRLPANPSAHAAPSAWRCLDASRRTAGSFGIRER